MSLGHNRCLFTKRQHQITVNPIQNKDIQFTLQKTRFEFRFQFQWIGRWLIFFTCAYLWITLISKTFTFLFKMFCFAWNNGRYLRWIFQNSKWKPQFNFDVGLCICAGRAKTISRFFVFDHIVYRLVYRSIVLLESR